MADSLEALAAEQAQGWYHLSKLLNERWAQVTKDDLFEPQPAYCTYCEHVPASVFLVSQEEPIYVCFNCLAEHDTVEQCGYCSELNTGSAGDSYLTGCVICEGKLGTIRED